MNTSLNNSKNNCRKIRFFAQFVLSSMIALLSVSCEDDLKEESFSSFTGDSFYNSVEAAEQGMYGIYNVLSSQDLYGRGYLLYFHTGTDIDRFWRQNRGNDDDLLANYQIEENNDWIGRAWSGFYRGISTANQLIQEVTVLRDNAAASGSSDLARYNNVLGDAYFLRAFMYFQLVKNWGDVPLRLAPIDLAKDDISSFKIERTPQVQVYEQIEKDMLLAISLVPEASQAVNTGRINKGAARGLLARMYLTWAGNPINDTSKFALAAEQAFEVINSGEHELNTNFITPNIGAPFNNPIQEVFTNISSKKFDTKESMWEINFAIVGSSTDNSSIIGVWHGVRSDDNSSFSRGAPRRIANPNFFNSFEADDTARRDWSIAQFEINSDDSFTALSDPLDYTAGKFRRYLLPSISPSRNQDGMNWPVIRYADVLLMLAESTNEALENGATLPAGVSLQTAYDAINQVRRRARMKDPNTADVTIDLTGGSGDTFRQQIRNERAWELCFENQRRPDLIRWGILEQTVKQAGVDLAPLGLDYLPASEIEPQHVLMPIPFAAEISQNPSILNTDATNNGYR